MSVYELTKDLFFPALLKWESHVVTIIFSTFLAAIASYFVLRYQQRFYLQWLREHMRGQAALIYERELLHALMDNIPDCIYFKDTASRFTRVNRAQALTLGVADPHDAVGKTDFDLQPLGLARSSQTEEQQLVTSKQPVIDRLEWNPTVDGQPRWFSTTKAPIRGADGQVIGIVGISRDITTRKMVEQEREGLITELREALVKNKTLHGLLPICASCKKIRDDTGYWNQLESYIRTHSEAEFSHGLCPTCALSLYGDLYEAR